MYKSGQPCSLLASCTYPYSAPYDALFDPLLFLEFQHTSAYPPVEWPPGSGVFSHSAPFPNSVLPFSGVYALGVNILEAQNLELEHRISSGLGSGDAGTSPLSGGPNECDPLPSDGRRVEQTRDDSRTDMCGATTFTAGKPVSAKKRRTSSMSRDSKGCILKSSQQRNRADRAKSLESRLESSTGAQSFSIAPSCASVGVEASGRENGEKNQGTLGSAGYTQERTEDDEAFEKVRENLSSLQNHLSEIVVQQKAAVQESLVAVSYLTSSYIIDSLKGKAHAERTMITE